MPFDPTNFHPDPRDGRGGDGKHYIAMLIPPPDPLEKAPALNPSTLNKWKIAAQRILIRHYGKSGVYYTSLDILFASSAETATLNLETFRNKTMIMGTKVPPSEWPPYKRSEEASETSYQRFVYFQSEGIEQLLGLFKFRPIIQRMIEEQRAFDISLLIGRDFATITSSNLKTNRENILIHNDRLKQGPA